MVCATIASILFLPVPTSSQAIQAPDCPPQIPASLADFLARTLQSWRIVDLADLLPDDRVLWERSRPQECPGIVSGRFFESPETAYALLVLRGKEREIHQRLIILTREKGAYKVTTVWEQAWTQTGTPGRVLVISRVSPGEYWDASRSRSVVTTRDAIALEAIEAGVTMYYWMTGKWHSLDIQI